jgi:hypothetical protein
MTFDQWLTIGVIVSRLIGPIRVTKTRIRTIGSWLWNIVQSPWYLPGLLILSNIYFLRLELLSTAPLTRRAIFSICMSVAGLFYAATLMSFNTIWRSIKRQQEIDVKQAETDMTICSVLNTHTELIGLTVNDLHTTAKNISLMLQAEEARAKITELESKGRKIA